MELVVSLYLKRDTNVLLKSKKNYCNYLPADNHVKVCGV